MEGVGTLKIATQQRFVGLLKKVDGEKDLVLDPDLMVVLNHFTNVTFLKQNGVSKMYRLEATELDSPCMNRIYIIRPQLQLISILIDQVRQDRKFKKPHKYHIFAVPQMTFCCEHLLEQHGLIGEFEVCEWPLDFVPLDSDLLSLELPGMFSELFLAEDRHGLRLIAQSICSLQLHCGKIPVICGVGKYSKMVTDLLSTLSAQQSFGAPEGSAPEIETLILFDRSCDLVTPLCSPSTYEGLLDDVFGIKSGFVEFEKSVTGKDQPVKLLLNSSDQVYADIRSHHFSSVFPYLSKLARELQVGYDRRHDAKSVQDMKAFVDELGGLKQQHRALVTHIGACEVINKKKGEAFIQEQLRVEHSTVDGFDEKECLEVIEELINRQAKLFIPLRLLCLLSITSGGIKAKVLQSIRRQFLQSYGYSHLLTLHHLEEMGWLCELAEQKQRPFFRSAVKRLKLVPKDAEHYNLDSPPDMAYVFGGAYTPLSCRLVQHVVTTGGWAGIEDLLYQVTPHVFPVEPVHSARSKSSAATSSARKGGVVVYFIGGCTFSELNALRFLSKQLKRPILISTTSMCRGSSLLEAIADYR